MPRRSQSRSVPRRSAGAEPPATVRPFERTRQDHATETAEDYVELIADLIRQAGEARLVDLAKALGISHVTANRTLRRLQREGLIQSRPYRAIFLTESGLALAQQSKERHKLVRDFLVALGVGEPQAEIDAEGLEHHVSRMTLKAMERYLRRNPSK
ncbi:MAG TPA: manganese-binding transcriptional regulator MntR [Phycisphaerae bacterium]|jgi:DtxR family manganese transport transcriptional regulator